jgi:hypothetical protein
VSERSYAGSATPTAGRKPKVVLLSDPRFGAAGWLVWRSEGGELLWATKPKHVTHSVRIRSEETVEEATERLWQHVLEAYPQEAELVC